MVIASSGGVATGPVRKFSFAKVEFLSRGMSHIKIHVALSFAARAAPSRKYAPPTDLYSASMARQQK
jgi:hypothetical protein